MNDALSPRVRGISLPSFEVLRLLISSILLFQAVSLAVDFRLVFSEGWAGNRLYDQILFGVYALSLIGLLAGYQIRLSASLACVLHFTLFCMNPLDVSGKESLSQLGLFFVLLSMQVDRTSRFFFLSPQFLLRALQLQVCLIYLALGVQRANAAGWWNGESVLHFSLLSPQASFSFQWLEKFPWVAKWVARSTIFFDLSFPILVWVKRTRRSYVFLSMIISLFIYFLLNRVAFPLVMLVLTLCAFGLDERD